MPSPTLCLGAINLDLKFLVDDLEGFLRDWGTGLTRGGEEAISREAEARLTALLDHYQRTGYGTPEKALADFVAVEAAVRQQIGRPPRTVEEFLAGKLAYMDGRPDTPPAQRQDLSRLAARYRLLKEL